MSPQLMKTPNWVRAGFKPARLKSIHGNQLAALLQIAATLNGQLIVATLRDKLPAMQKMFVTDIHSA